MGKDDKAKKQPAALVSKISVKTVCGKIDRKTLTEEPKAIMRVLGIAKAKFTGEGDKGAYVGFKGQFKATNLETGKQYFSGKMYLPGSASDLLEGQFTGDPKQDAPVNFGFTITVQEDESSSVGYIYGCESLMEPDEADPIKLLEEKLENK